MCGITGIFNFQNNTSVDERDLVKAGNTLIHRGPDDSGTYISRTKKVGLAFRRLAIIDLSPAGHQPMTNEDNTVWIIFNGEIYNFQELRPELEKKGHIFRSKSDTETLIHTYEEYGEDCLKYLNGMFAFAIWDEKKQLLFVARDRLGIKPFYYAVQNNTFYFGSEIKAILAYPNFKKELEETNVSHYLTFSCLPAPCTLFKDVKKLPGAHAMVVHSNGAIKEWEYWNPAKILHINKTEQEYIANIRFLLEDSIKSQMVSDVPFGCFLSGGIDSSTNAALMSKALGKPVETFSIGSKQYEKYNEFKYSRKVAKLLDTKPHEYLVEENTLLEFLPKYAHYADDPNGDQICFLLFELAKHTRQNGVIVIQIGEGSDEIFAGYSTYLQAFSLHEKYWKLLKNLPQGVKNEFWNISNALLKRPKWNFWKEYLHRLKENQESYWGNAIAFGEARQEHLLSEDYKQRTNHYKSYDIIEKYYKEMNEYETGADFLERMTYLELKERLSELLLMRADKMIMAHSVEARVPFLDHRLVELAFHIPASIKFKNKEPKYILKKAVEGIIPDEIIWRKKQGFAGPMSEWFKKGSPIERHLVNTIKNSKLRERNILNYEYVNILLTEHQTQGVDNNFRLWNLVTLSLWYDHWFK